MESIQQIKNYINDNELEIATGLLKERVLVNPKDDEAFFLLGNIYRKQSNWKPAIECYLTALDINPNSPTRQAHEMVMEILSFNNPDLYNP